MLNLVKAVEKQRFGAWFLQFVLVAATIMLAGCGGSGGSGLSQADLQRMAANRPKDKDQGDAAPAAEGKAKATQSSTNKTSTAAQPTRSPARGPQPTPAADVQKSNPPEGATAAESGGSTQPNASTTESATAASGGPENRPESDTKSPPAAPLDAAARARMTVDNMTRIGQAFEAYLKDKRMFPTRAIFDGDKQPLLSWRVMILPYLGYKDLYSQFRLDEPWSSPHNQALVAKIPAVYQSPERFDQRTNYLLPVDTSTIFGGDRPAIPLTVEDGVRNTVFVLEVDDKLAIPWTEPRDYALDLGSPIKNLGGLRGNSFYVIWGNGQVGRILTSAHPLQLRAMFTHDGNEDFASGKIDQPLIPAALAAAPAVVGGTPAVAPSLSSTGTAALPGHTTAPIAYPPTGVGASPAGNAALTTLARTYQEYSTQATEQNNEREARLWFHAAAIVAPTSDSWLEKYQWVPALKRPSVGVRFGIGLQYSGPRRTQLENELAKQVQRGVSGGNSVWSTTTKEIGKSLVEALSSHVEKSGAAALAPPPQTDLRGRPLVRSTPRVNRSALLLTSAHGETLAPSVHFLTLADEPVLKAMARREGIDVLVLVDWKDLGNKQAVRFELIDPVRSESLLIVPWFDSTDVADAIADPLASNPFPDRLRQLSEFLEQQLTPQPLPPQIQPRHVVGRLAALAAAKSENPLAALAEMRYYRERGLADDAQLIVAYQSLLGQEPGSTLFLGDAGKRELLLKPWLPKPPVTPSNPQRTAAADDD